MKLYAGLDGGQSSTVAVIGDERGRILGRGAGGPCDHVDEPLDSSRLHDALNGALTNAAKSANLNTNTRYAAIVAGVSGLDDGVPRMKAILPARRVRFLHDAPIAWQGAFGGDPGVVVIAGTGSVAYGRDVSGSTATVGGWGYLFGDGGSAFSIARSALALAMREEDAGRSNTLAIAALKYFKRSSLRELAHGFYIRRINRTQLAAFASAVADLAGCGDVAAANVIGDAMHALAVLASDICQALQCGPVPTVAFAGGLMLRAELRAAAEERLRWVMPQARSVRPLFEPAVGALLLAYQEDGQAAPSLRPEDL